MHQNAEIKKPAPIGNVPNQKTQPYPV